MIQRKHQKEKTWSTAGPLSLKNSAICLLLYSYFKYLPTFIKFLYILIDRFFQNGRNPLIKAEWYQRVFLSWNRNTNDDEWTGKRETEILTPEYRKSSDTFLKIREYWSFYLSYNFTNFYSMKLWMIFKEKANKNEKKFIRWFFVFLVFCRLIS